ncbi:MAG TPA: nucleotide sugar dehydrogenase [Thermodesulfobacteriota bacterium]|nr:nucleotide sugar dehydrogenase [Thermodesulfobacteriota bacterium]
MQNHNLSNPVPAISIVGLGKLGAPTAACYAYKGFNVVGVDVNVQTVRMINEGHAPVFEPGLEEMIQTNKVRLSATTEYGQAVLNSQITFILVPTPSDDHYGFSLRYVLEAVEQIGKVLRTKKDYHLVVVTSTVLPGATDNEIKPMLEAHSGKRCGSDFGLCYNPEFVALGTVIRDFLNPDFILIGESDPRAGELLTSCYQRLCDNRPSIVRMNAINAEITKLSVNTFVTTKITFANMLARICEKLPGADVDVVTSALGQDSRIGRKYLRGAIGYGGPCFPRDNLALSFLAQRVGAPATLAEATDRANRLQVNYLAGLVKSKLMPGGVVGVLGLTYKPQTDVVEESQGLLLSRVLAADNLSVTAYDPAGMENARRVLGTSVTFTKSLEDCVKKSDVIVITTPWEEFRSISDHLLAPANRPRVVIDCWRLFNAERFGDAIEYITLGIGRETLAPKGTSERGGRNG